MKTKLTPEIKEKIGKNIRLGMSIKNAVIAAGIHESTYYDWINKGEKATRGLYAEFSEYITECKAISEQRHVGIIVKAASKGEWQASKFILQSRFPKEWGRTDNLNITGKIKTEEEHAPLTDEIIEARNAYLKAVSNAKKQTNGPNETKK